MFIRSIFGLAQIFLLFQLSLRLVIACDDECIISISKAFAGNYSQQIDDIFSRISKKFRANLPPETRLDSIIELGRRKFYDQVFTQAVFELDSASSGSTKLDSVMQSSEKLFSIVIDVLNPALREVLSAVKENLDMFVDWEKSASVSVSNADQTFSSLSRKRSRRSMSSQFRGSLSRFTRRETSPNSTYFGFPRTVSTIPVRKARNGTVHLSFSWRKRSSSEGLVSFPQAISRFFKRTPRSSHNVVTRSELPSAGAPRTVSTIPTSGTFDPIKTDSPTSHPPSTVTIKECLLNLLSVCVPNFVNILEKRTLAIFTPASASAPQLIPRLFKRISNSAFQGSSQHIAARSEPPSTGAPRTVSTIPTSATFDPITTDPPNSHSPSKVTNKECLFNLLSVCVPNVLNSLKKRTMAILTPALVSASQVTSGPFPTTSNSVILAVRSESPSTGAPQTVSTIPTSATFDPITTDPPTSHSPSKVTNKECLLNLVSVCIPNVLNSLKKRSIVILKPATVPRDSLKLILQPLENQTASKSSHRKIIVFENDRERLDHPIRSSRIAPKKSSGQRDFNHPRDQESSRKAKLTKISLTSFPKLMESLGSRLEDYHQGLWNGPLKEYILSFE